MAVIRAASGFLRSQQMQSAVRDIVAAIGSADGVLISGEAGTGREAAARAIHQASSGLAAYPLEDLLRSGRKSMAPEAPFIVVDCGASREIEHQLFGTAASANGRGELDRISHEALLYRAFGGTLFLRSVHEMPARVQARISRVLRDSEVWVEGVQPNPVLASVTLRVIASIDPAPSDRDDDRVVRELAKRLTAHRIELPPLRQRPCEATARSSIRRSVRPCRGRSPRPQHHSRWRAEQDRRHLARLARGDPAGPALRLSPRWTIRAPRRTSIQPEQAGARSLRQGGCPCCRSRFAAGGGLRSLIARGGPVVLGRGHRRHRGQVRRHARGFRLAGRSAPPPRPPGLA